MFNGQSSFPPLGFVLVVLSCVSNVFRLCFCKFSLDIVRKKIKIDRCRYNSWKFRDSNIMIANAKKTMKYCWKLTISIYCFVKIFGIKEYGK